MKYVKGREGGYSRDGSTPSPDYRKLSGIQVKEFKRGALASLGTVFSQGAAL